MKELIKEDNLRYDEEGRRICSIGDRASLTKTFTQEDINTFADLSIDYNGMHTDPELAQRGLFRRPVVHGVLVGSLISSVMGMKLPGNGAVIQGQDIKFLCPVYPGDTITAEVELTDIVEKERYYLATIKGSCRNQDDLEVASATCSELMLKRFFVVE